MTATAIQETGRGPRRDDFPKRASWLPRRPALLAQVREDPRLESKPSLRCMCKVVVVSSAAAPRCRCSPRGARVTAVDLNLPESLVELKVAALRRLTMPEIMSFSVSPAVRQAPRPNLRAIRPLLSERAVDFWDAHQSMLGRGALACGVSEQFISVVVKVVKLFIHGRGKIERLLSLESLEQQREFFDREWNTRRWRLLFPALLNRWTFNRTYDPAFFREVENPSFADHFQRLLEHRSVSAGAQQLLPPPDSSRHLP